MSWRKPTEQVPCVFWQPNNQYFHGRGPNRGCATCKGNVFLKLKCIESRLFAVNLDKTKCGPCWSYFIGLWQALRQSLQDTAMDWTGAAAARNCGYVLLGILVMVGMEIALEELGFWMAMYVRSQIILNSWQATSVIVLSRERNQPKSPYLKVKTSRNWWTHLNMEKAFQA